MIHRTPPDDDPRDHGTPCPNCGEIVPDGAWHLVPATMTDPAWWECDRIAKAKETP